MNRRRILFGVKAGWNEAIATVLDRDRFDCAAIAFDEAAGRYDAVVPLTLDQQAELRARPGAFGGRYLVPDGATESLCHDKRRFNRFLIGEGFRDLVPAMIRPRLASPPFVLKRRRDEFGARSHVVPDAAALVPLASLLDDPAYFAQALVPGRTEFTSHLLAVDGEVRHQLHIAYEMAGEACIRGGAARPLASRVLAASPAPGLAERIAGLLRYTGVGCLNYKMAGGRPQLFEFNPRFGSSLTRDVNAFLDAYLAALDTPRRARAAALETAV